MPATSNEPGAVACRAGPADPRAVSLAHDGLQRADQPARAWPPLCAAARTLRPIDGQPARDHDEVVIARGPRGVLSHRLGGQVQRLRLASAPTARGFAMRSLGPGDPVLSTFKYQQPLRAAALAGCSPEAAERSRLPAGRAHTTHNATIASPSAYHPPAVIMFWAVYCLRFLSRGAGQDMAPLTPLSSARQATRNATQWSPAMCPLGEGCSDAQLLGHDQHQHPTSLAPWPADRRNAGTRRGSGYTCSGRTGMLLWPGRSLRLRSLLLSRPALVEPR